MKKFKFRLQTVHDLRETVRDREEQTLIQKQHDVDHALEQIAKIEQACADAVEKHSEMLRSGKKLDATELELSSMHIASLNMRLKDAHEILTQKRVIRDEQAVRLGAAERDAKVTEKLREKQRARHKEDAEKAEQTALDEIVATGFARRILSKGY